MAEKQVLALSGKSRGVLRLEYGQELAFSLESPAYLRDAELWLLFSDREWSILDRCKGSCPLPARRVQAAAVARGGQFLMAGGRADFSAARSACFTRQEKKRLKELEVSARQRPKPSEILSGQPEGQIFQETQRRGAETPSARQGRKAENERPAQASAAQQETAAGKGQETAQAAQAQPAPETRQKKQGSWETRQGGQGCPQASQAQWAQEGRGREREPAFGLASQEKTQAMSSQEKQSAAPEPLGHAQTAQTDPASEQRRQSGQDEARTAWELAPQKTPANSEPQSQAQSAFEQRRNLKQREPQTAPEPMPRMRQSVQEQESAPSSRQKQPTAAFSRDSQPESMPEAPGTRRQEGAPSQPRQAFSGQEGGAGPGNSHSSAYRGGRDSRAFGRGQSQAPGAPARGAMSQQRRQWENLPEYVSTPALEELMRAAQPQSTSPRRGRVGMQEPRRHSFSAPQAGRMQGGRQEGPSAWKGQGGEDERPAQAASARQETAAFSQIVQPSSASEMHQPGSTPAQQEQAAWEQKTAPAAQVQSALEPRQKAQSAPQLRPGEGRQKAAGPSARSAPEQAASGQSAQAVPETAAHSSAQKAKAQPERPQSGQQKQGAKSAPRYACIQRTEKSVQPFPKIFPSSKWVKVEYPSFPGRGYYLSGEIFQGEKCAAKALAVPGRYALNPPAWLKGFETYLEDASAQGYWLLFQDMQGKAIPISQVFKGSQG